MGSNLGHYLYERSSRFRSCLRHLPDEGVSAMTLEEKRKRKRDPEDWVWRYHGGAEGKKGSKPAVSIEDVKKYPTRSAA
jgi:hypothetical protein